MKTKQTMIAAALIAFAAPGAYAHFPMLIPDSPFAEVNQSVEILYSVGHPYERDYEDAEKPHKVTAIPSAGSPEDITSALAPKPLTVSGITHGAWSVAFAPKQSGDTVIALDSAPSISRNGETLYQEYVKTVIHAERQRGWDARTGRPLEIVPLTRPYGLQEGFVFTGRLMKGDEPVAGETIYIEQFVEEVPDPDNLPPEPLITQVVKTGEGGYFTHTLPNAGWWVMGAYVDGIGEIGHEGKTYRLNAFAGLWVRVEPLNRP